MKFLKPIMPRNIFPLFIFVITGPFFSLSGQSYIAAEDTSAGYVIFTFDNGVCGDTEHVAPTGEQLHLDISGFVRHGVNCASSGTSGYISTDWPATGKVNPAAYVYFNIVPHEDFEVIIPPGGLSFQVQRTETGPDSMEVIIKPALHAPISILKVHIGDELRHLYTSTSLKNIISSPSTVMFYAWSSTASETGITTGNLLLDEVAFFYKTYSTVPVVPSGDAEISPKFTLSPPYPNPFYETLYVDLRLYRTERVKAELYTTLGQKVQTVIDEEMTPGDHKVTINATGLTGTVYILRVSAGGYTMTRNFILVKRHP